MRVTIGLIMFFIVLGTAGECQIIGHANVDLVDKLPQSVMTAVGHQKWFFTHASVGGNMIEGMCALHDADPNRYKLTVTSVSYNSTTMRAYNPPDPTASGCIYECNRGNPGWSSKFTIFDNSVRLGNWRYSNVDLCMDKLCYIDQDASATQYTTKMSAIEAFSPNTIFIYTTMPLTTSADSDNVLRNQYNQTVRSFCAANKKLLLDIADIEAYDPNNIQQTFQYGGNTYQKLYSGYSTDGGHLNSTGEQRVAKGWYAVAAATVPYGTTNRGAADAVTGIASYRGWFTVWGKVILIDGDSFWVNDGSKNSVKVIAPGFSGFGVGDTVKAWGLLDNSSGSAVITSSAGRVLKVN